MRYRPDLQNIEDLHDHHPMPDPSEVFAAAKRVGDAANQRRYAHRVMASAVLARLRAGDGVPSDALELMASAVVELTADVATGTELDDFRGER